MLPAEQAALFAYDATADLEVVVNDTTTRSGAIIQDITFVPIAGEAPVKAYIVTPADAAPSYAGILWGHWLGDKYVNRTQFLEEAVNLAKSGVVSVMLDAMWAKSGWYGYRSLHLDDDYTNGIKQVIRFRRAMDLLVAQPHVDPTRIAFVGHDYSGMYGMLASAVDGRAKAYVFLFVAPSFYDWAFYTAKPADMAAYKAQNDQLEPMTYLPHINGSFFLQFAKNDFYVPAARRQLTVDTTPEPKKVVVYDKAEHIMDSPEIITDRAAWLRDQLNLT